MFNRTNLPLENFSSPSLPSSLLPASVSVITKPLQGSFRTLPITLLYLKSCQSSTTGSPPSDPSGHRDLGSIHPSRRSESPDRQGQLLTQKSLQFRGLRCGTSSSPSSSKDPKSSAPFSSPNAGLASELRRSLGTTRNRKEFSSLTAPTHSQPHHKTFCFCYFLVFKNLSALLALCVFIHFFVCVYVFRRNVIIWIFPWLCFMMVDVG